MSIERASLPSPDMVMPAGLQTGLIVVVGALVIAALVHALILLRRGDNRLLVMLGCGAAASLLEGFACHLIQCAHAPIGNVEVYEIFGVHVPLWLALLYVLFFGAAPFYFVERFSKAPSALYFWTFAAIVGASEGIGEMVLMSFGTHMYYGVQPLPIFGFPLYLGFVNPFQDLAIGLIGATWFKYVKGARRFLLIPLTPWISASIYGGLTYPTSGFLHDGNSSAMVIGSLISISLCLILGAFTYRGLKLVTQK